MPLTSTVEISRGLSERQGLFADAEPPSRRDFTMASEKAARFPRTARLLRHADFERVYKLGRRHFSASMTVFYWPRPIPEEDGERKQASETGTLGVRVGFTVGRVLGGAVQRNRMKRRLREAVRRSGLPSGIMADVVINPKKSLLAADFCDVLKEVGRAFAVIEQKLSQNSGKGPGEPASSRERLPGKQNR